MRNDLTTMWYCTDWWKVRWSDHHVVLCWLVECTMIWVWFMHSDKCKFASYQCNWYLSLSINVRYYLLWGSRDSWLVRGRTRDQKVASSNPGRSGGRIFFSRVNFVCWLLFGVRSTPVLPQWHVKGPGHSAKSAGGRLHLNTHTSLTQRSRSGLTMPPSRHSVWTYHETSSHTTRQGTLSNCRLSSLSHCGLIRG